MLEILFWAFVGPAALAAVYSIRTGRHWQEHVEGQLRPMLLDEDEEDEEEPEPWTPPATLILPVKGVDHDLAEALRSLAAQDYPDYELLIAARSANDPALQTVRMTLGDKARVVIAGPPPAGTGEKVHNLLAAVAAARPESAVLAFADSDAQVAPAWLRALAAPLADETLGAATGFRWYFPEDGGFWPLLRSVWDSTIAGAMRADRKNFCWGGAMALRCETFKRAGVERFWRGTVSDDYRLSAAMHAAGLGVEFVPGAMAATPGGCTAREFLSWARRQLVITKVYNKKIWIAGFIAHIVYCGAILMSLLLAANGNPLGLGGLVVAIIPGMAKGGMRGYAAQLMFPEREAWLERFGWAYFWFTPIATWIWLWAFFASATTRRIEWRGYVYELSAADSTRTLAAPAENL